MPRTGCCPPSLCRCRDAALRRLNHVQDRNHRHERLQDVAEEDLSEDRMRSTAHDTGGQHSMPRTGCCPPSLCRCRDAVLQRLNHVQDRNHRHERLQDVAEEDLSEDRMRSTAHRIAPRRQHRDKKWRELMNCSLPVPCRKRFHSHLFEVWATTWQSSRVCSYNVSR